SHICAGARADAARADRVFLAEGGPAVFVAGSSAAGNCDAGGASVFRSDGSRSWPIPHARAAAPGRAGPGAAPDHYPPRVTRRRLLAARPIPPSTRSVVAPGSGTDDPPLWPDSKALAKALPNSAESCAGDSVGMVLPNVVPRIETSVPSHL